MDDLVDFGEDDLVGYAVAREEGEEGEIGGFDAVNRVYEDEGFAEPDKGMSAGQVSECCVGALRFPPGCGGMPAAKQSGKIAIGADVLFPLGQVLDNLLAPLVPT